MKFKSLRRLLDLQTTQMHSSNFETEVKKSEADVLVAVTTLVTEGRIPNKLNTKNKSLFEGPHCNLGKSPQDHKCDLSNNLCLRFECVRDEVISLWQKNIPLCIEVVLTCGCNEEENLINAETPDHGLLLEQWFFTITHKRSSEAATFRLFQLVNAIRSQLYFSQITAWLTCQDENTAAKLTPKNIRYRLALPGETFEASKFSKNCVTHNFPPTDIGNNIILNVSFLSLPRTSTTPTVSCPKCALLRRASSPKPETSEQFLLDDRMHLSCTMKGKHRCDDYEELDQVMKVDFFGKSKRLCHSSSGTSCGTSCPSTSQSSSPASSDNYPSDGMREVNLNGCQNGTIMQFNGYSLDQLTRKTNAFKACHKSDLNGKSKESKAQILLDAIQRSGHKTRANPSLKKSDKHCDATCVQDRANCANKSDCDNASCDIYNNNKYTDKHCDSPMPSVRHRKMKDISNFDLKNHKTEIRRKLSFDEYPEKCCKQNNGYNNNACVGVPTPLEQAKFRKNLDNAASMVFHARTGLPLTSSPAPVRRGTSCFDYDSTLNSVSAIKSALFSTSFSTDDESESDGSIVSPCSPETYVIPQREASPVKYRRKGHAANLLGSFEESVLNGRLEPVSTVHGFTAELGASGSFVPKHLVVPVTVFFYTLGDNDKVSSPYLGHINLGKKGYNVPKSGTVQVTLFNPLGTVVKMFVIMYDLSDMPPNSQTFIRQRTLYMPTHCKDENLEWGPKWLRYLIHLRFMTSKSGKIYLHSDIRMIIFRKCDLDTATAHGIDMSYELRSFTHMPANPRFSPRK